MSVLAPAATLDQRRRGPHRSDVQTGLLFASIVVTAIAGLGVSLLFPAGDGGGPISPSAVERDRSFVWVFLTLAGANLVLTVVPAALASVLLVPARGWRWATAGFAIGIVGAALYAAGVGGWAMVSYFAADAGGGDAAAVTAFIRAVNGDVLHSFAPAAAGAILVALGSILLFIGLWRSGNVPRWVATLGIVGTIATFILPTDGAVGVLVESPQAVASVLVGWALWRRRDGSGAEVA